MIYLFCFKYLLNDLKLTITSLTFICVWCLLLSPPLSVLPGSFILLVKNKKKAMISKASEPSRSIFGLSPKNWTWISYFVSLSFSFPLTQILFGLCIYIWLWVFLFLILVSSFSVLKVRLVVFIICVAFLVFK